MSIFFFEDTCTFKADHAIIGTIERTWSDVEGYSSKAPAVCYVHKDLPLRVRLAWFNDQKLSPGYVIVEFKEDYDGHCIVAESCLQLVDRSFAVGDVVKKKFQDTQSGTVISTSIMCSLRPLCREADYLRQQNPAVFGHTPSHGPHAPKAPKDKGTAPNHKLVHGFPALTISEHSRLDPLDIPIPHLLQAPASELKFWNKYREEDTLIYKGWVGKVKSVYDEVTVRLGNGSVVVVENADELEEPYWVAGTPSYELVQRLDRAGYYQYRPGKQTLGVGKPRSIPAEPCYPGQYVQTKKGNFRCGKWKIGAYDPAITTAGIVVDVRNVQLEVRWLSAVTTQQTPLQPPSPLLDTEELETGGITVYDRGRLPTQPLSSTLVNASYSLDTGFGHGVRFRDPAAAAVKYGPVPEGATPNSTTMFDRIPQAATQGFDMNVLQVVATASKVMVRWQDCSSTEEDSTQLFYYMSPDQSDAWPGQKISYVPDEEKLGVDVPIIRLHKVGVAQSVNSGDRIAHVRWFEGTEIDVDEEKALQYSASRYGKLRDEVVEVPLYDIASYEALPSNRGDLVTIAPEQAPSPAPVVGQKYLESSVPIDSVENIDMLNEGSGSRALSRVGQPPPSFDSGLMTSSVQSARTFLGLTGGDFDSTPRGSSLPPDTEMVGEITDLCLDGDIVVRLGAAFEVREVKLPLERVRKIASANAGSSEYSDEEDEYEVEDLYVSDAMSVSDQQTDHETDQDSVEAMDISVEYEGGEKLNDEDDDEEMWATEEEDIENLDMQKSAKNDSRLDQYLDPMKDGYTQLDGEIAQAPPNVNPSTHSPITYSSYSSKPPGFCVLESEAPPDHHFVRSTRPLTADFMRRVMKEHKIMQSSLPDGIFVRAWESRLDLLRVLIVGPLDTPYEWAPFVVDFHFGLSFPAASPDAHFHSWTGNGGRINPNLYEDGKICLSLLGTWDADERNEEWSSKKSTVLQILVSLLGLILVKEPYFSKTLTVSSSQTPPSDDCSPFEQGVFCCPSSMI